MRVSRSLWERSRYTDVPGWVSLRRSFCPQVGPSYALTSSPIAQYAQCRCGRQFQSLRFLLATFAKLARVFHSSQYGAYCRGRQITLVPILSCRRLTSPASVKNGYFHVAPAPKRVDLTRIDLQFEVTLGLGKCVRCRWLLTTVAGQASDCAGETPNRVVVELPASLIRLANAAASVVRRRARPPPNAGFSQASRTEPSGASCAAWRSSAM